MNTIKDFTGVTAFLNGEEGLHDIDQPLHEAFLREGLAVKILDNLFEDPTPLKDLGQFSNLVLFTTGQNNDLIRPLQELVRKSGFVPKNVIFLSEETAMTFLNLARDLKEKGTKFFFVWIYDFSLEEISWI